MDSEEVVEKGTGASSPLIGGEDPSLSGKDDPKADDLEGASDPELEELLDMSLGEFGKHVQPPSPPPKPKATPTIPPSREAEFDQVFGEEFAAQAETQLNEAMKMMQSENPDLWKQFEEFSKTVGVSEGAALNVGGVASTGESSVDDSATNDRERSLTNTLEETLKKLKESTANIESGGDGSDSFGQLDLNSEDNEDQLLKMMQGMMSSLLSRDVLYPSLMELCKQYPEWLRTHKSEVSRDDYQRYSKQLDIMTTICREFEGQPGETEPSEASSERVLTLMQQLQQCGQPPAELAADSEGAGFLPSGTGLPNLDPQNCTVM